MYVTAWRHPVAIQPPDATRGIGSQPPCPPPTRSIIHERTEVKHRRLGRHRPWLPDLPGITVATLRVDITATAKPSTHAM